MTAEPPVQIPSLDRPLGAPDFPLSRTALPDDDGPFTLRGAHALARGRTAGGTEAVEAAGVPALRHPRIANAEALSGTFTPVGLERRLRVGGVDVVERVVVPRSGPICFLEWRAEEDVLLRFEAQLSPAAGAIAAPALQESATVGRAPSPGEPASAVPETRLRTLERGVLLHGAVHQLLLGFSVRPVRLRVGGGPEPRVEAELSVPAGGAVRASVAVATDRSPLDGLLRMMGRTHVAVPARAAEARRVLDQGLVLHSPEPDLDDALAWARTELAGLVGEPTERDPAGEPGATGDPGAAGDAAAAREWAKVERAFAALAVGEAAAARAELERLATPPSAGGADASRRAGALLLLASGYLAWTGDIRTLQAHWPAVREAAAAALAAGAGARAGAADADRVTVLRSLVVPAEEVGDTELAAQLRRSVGAPPPGAALVPWPRAVGGAAGEAGSAAGLVAAVVLGLLGIEPDAPRGRLVLRPRLPSGWARLSFRGLDVGGAAVELDYVRDGSRHRYTLRQARGSAPLRVILEPELDGGRVARAAVDGEPAELETVVADGRTRVPLQVVLDHERRVEVEMERRPG